MLSHICPALLKTTFCAHLFFYYSFTVFDGTEATTAGRVVSPRSIMMYHDFRGEACKKTKYRIRQTTSHSSLLVARQGDVFRKLNQAFLLVDSLSSNFYCWRSFNNIYSISLLIIITLGLGLRS